MDIFFPDPNDPALPPEAVRLRNLRAEPWPDGRHVKVLLELTPFQKLPSAEIFLTGPGDQEAARTSILETISRKMELNLHLKPGSPSGDYTLHVTLYYQHLPTAEQPDAPIPEPLIVDSGQYSFNIPPQATGA
jgi:hypothetical protein